MNESQESTVRKEVTFSIECQDEWEQVAGNAMASGDDKVDECNAEIYRQLDSGNEWAWCCVRVVAEWNGLEGDDYLGCCSYASEADFRVEGGYYDDMKNSATLALLAKIDRVQL